MFWGGKTYKCHCCVIDMMNHNCQGDLHLLRRKNVCWLHLYIVLMPFQRNWSMSAEANAYSQSGPQTRELAPFQQWWQDKRIIETSRNCYCQRFVSMNERKSSELSIILSKGCSRPSGCPGQHDAPVQKLNARPALPSSSPTVDFPPLYPTWASKPAQHTHTK